MTTPRGITRIAVSGFKSIDAEQAIEIAPLTILAGVNSSGKSSIMQPLLLLKQTLEAPYDPGALLLNGANVKFSQASQMLHKRKTQFTIAISLDSNFKVTLRFKRVKTTPSIEIAEAKYLTEFGYLTLDSTLSAEDTQRQIVNMILFREQDQFADFISEMPLEEFAVTRNRSFLQTRSDMFLLNTDGFIDSLQLVIHVPGLRSSPERAYPVTAVGEYFSGTFDHYTASVILSWQENENKKGKLNKLSAQLVQLGLTWKVEARRLDDTRIELRVGRTQKPKQGGAQDMVSVADVGFGVSQTLPVLVALLVAEPGQLVYIEQPEIHLHPRAQVAMAGILADAAKRGVRVVIETHSSLLLTAVQTLIAEGDLDPALVRLHWFNRDEEGVTTIESVTPDETGAYGEWPVDFGDVELDIEGRYIEAASQKLIGQTNGSHEKQPIAGD